MTAYSGNFIRRKCVCIMNHHDYSRPDTLLLLSLALSVLQFNLDRYRPRENLVDLRQIGIIVRRDQAFLSIFEHSVTAFESQFWNIIQHKWLRVGLGFQRLIGSFVGFVGVWFLQLALGNFLFNEKLRNQRVVAIKMILQIQIQNSKKSLLFPIQNWGIHKTSTIRNTIIAYEENWLSQSQYNLVNPRRPSEAYTVCVGKLTIIGSENGSKPGCCQAINWTNAGKLSIGPPGTKFNEISIGIQTFPFKKMHFKMSFAKWRPFCHCLNVLTSKTFVNVLHTSKSYPRCFLGPHWRPVGLPEISRPTWHLCYYNLLDTSTLKSTLVYFSYWEIRTMGAKGARNPWGFMDSMSVILHNFL